MLNSLGLGFGLKTYGLILGTVSSSWYLAFALRVEDLALALKVLALSTSLIYTLVDLFVV